MSFSIIAAGTKDQVLDTLRRQDFTSSWADQLGATIRDVLVKVVEESADGASGGGPLRYEIAASGHAGPGTVPSLTASLTVRPAELSPPAA